MENTKGYAFITAAARNMINQILYFKECFFLIFFLIELLSVRLNNQYSIFSRLFISFRLNTETAMLSTNITDAIALPVP